MTHCRCELTDHQWSIISSLLPNKPRGIPWIDDRRVLNGILWRFRAGSPWSEIPERYGPLTTFYNHFVRWQKVSVWDRLLEAISEVYDSHIVMIESACVRVNQHAVTKKNGGDGSMDALAADLRAWFTRWLMLKAAPPSSA
ncbi:IS5 family transposase [Brucella sp. 09RB8910]|nr:IS5 family transposase [Brucella sp. 09RB8910]